MAQAAARPQRERPASPANWLIHFPNGTYIVRFEQNDERTTELMAFLVAMLCTTIYPNTRLHRIAEACLVFLISSCSNSIEAKHDLHI